MYSTWWAISLIRLPNVPDPGAGESRTRIRKPSALSSMYRSNATAAASNFSLVLAPPRMAVAVVSRRSTSRSTTTAYRPSLPPKCSYTTGLETPACAAISSTDVPSKPRSANSLRPMSSSCSRRSRPVMRLRWLLPAVGLVTHSSSRLCRRAVTRRGRGLGHRAQGHVTLAGELRGQPPLVRPPDVPGPAELLGPPDDPGADVDLALERAVPGARGIAVVQVVPGLAEGRDGQPGDVARLVPDFEVLVPERVADRVDRPGDVVQQADADQAGPEEGGERPGQRHRPQAPDQRGPEQGDRRPERERLGHPADGAVGQRSEERRVG